jgi:hypothetical protein
MAPVAAAVYVMIGAAIVTGFFAGLIGGIVVWRARIHIGWGGLLAFLAYILLSAATHDWDLHWLSRELVWGAPSMSLAFLLYSVSARCLERRFSLHPNWTVFAALGLTLILGFPYGFLFRLDFIAPLLVALVVDALLILLLIRARKLAPQ